MILISINKFILSYKNRFMYYTFQINKYKFLFKFSYYPKWIAGNQFLNIYIFTQPLSYSQDVTHTIFWWSTPGLNSEFSVS